MKKVDQLRLFMSNESPTFSDLQLQSFKHNISDSPMTDLAANLSGTSLVTPIFATRRRLSLSVCSDENSTPGKDIDTPIGVKMDCGDENRLFKGAIKLPNPNREPGGLSRNRGFSRRIILNSTFNDENSDSLKNKENCIMSSSDVHQMFSPVKSPGSMRQRHPLEDFDPNSQDSGYSASYPDKDTGFRFTEPFGVPPRRHLVERSPRKENSTSPRRQICSPHRFNSLSSGSAGSDSVDDGFIELYDIDKYSEDANLPFGLNNLLNKPILPSEDVLNNPIFNDENAVSNKTMTCLEEKPRISFHRSFSVGDNTTPNSSRARSCLFKSSNVSPKRQPILDSVPYNFESVRCFKRPEPPCDNSPSKAKRRKSCALQSISENENITDPVMMGFCVKRPVKLQRSYSETETTIMNALHRSYHEPDLIGDFTRPYLLPLMDGRHQDLKTISPDTLSNLISGKFDDTIASYSIVDCRYPYEFEGGHIRGAKNVYTRDQILKEFVNVWKDVGKCETSLTSVKRKHIVVFHCEFSSERGPSLYRFLRNCDRDHNKECYPALFYPELYLLEGGYKNFFQKHSHMCDPQAYRPMLHPENEGDLRHFRAKSKSWNGETKNRLALRHNLNRLGF